MHIQKLLNWKANCSAVLYRNEVNKKLFLSLGLITVLALTIWVLGAYINWSGYYPLALKERRLYLILLLYAMVLLKWLLLDYVPLDLSSIKDKKIKKYILGLQSQLQTVNEYICSKQINKHGQSIKLASLPWIAIIGPKDSGKTTLLSSAKIMYYLKPQVDQIRPTVIPSCWVTKENTLLDLPGHFFSANKSHISGEVRTTWGYFLRLIKKMRGRNGLNAILITLPASYLVGEETKQLFNFLENIKSQINEVRQTFQHDLAYYIVITKCDSISGFSEYFNDSSEEEIIQPWGVSLLNRHGKTVIQSFSERFDVLIKKLNLQLLTRLHQEINIQNKPRIKDFPLQIQQLKKTLIELLQKLSSAKINIQGLYLTSAYQTIASKEFHIAREHNRQLQILQAPHTHSRAFFIKHLLLYINTKLPARNKTHKKAFPLDYLVYAAGLLLIFTIMINLSKDFTHGLYDSTNLATRLDQIRIVNSHNFTDIFEQNVLLLDVLREGEAKKPSQGLDLAKYLKFYTKKNQYKNTLAYQHALKNTLLPIVKNYLGAYLQASTQYTPDEIYSVFKAYKMLGEVKYFDADYILKTLDALLPQNLKPHMKKRLHTHLYHALLIWQPLALDQRLISNWQNYFLSLPTLKLTSIILENYGDNQSLETLNLGTIPKNIHTFKSPENINIVKKMYTIAAFSRILSRETLLAAQEAYYGNWLTGPRVIAGNQAVENLVESIRIDYLNQYIRTWEKILTSIQLASPKNLDQTYRIIHDLSIEQSPLLLLLSAIHDNTYFEPIVSSSTKLQKVSLLLDQDQTSFETLHHILITLQQLDHSLANILQAENQKKAAFEFADLRMQGKDEQDPITQLRTTAKKLPQPLKGWMEDIADHTWTYIMQDAAKYIDLSWQTRVLKPYQQEIANRYPFTRESKQEVQLQNFANFFGNPGTILDFHHLFLNAFIDTASPNWQWKKIDSLSLPFSAESLNKIRQALQIHKIFFPNNGDKPYVKFALKPYKFSKQVQRISLLLNDKLILDEQDLKRTAHLVLWPQTQKTNIKIQIDNGETINQDYTGDWGWFRFINQNFESALTKKGILLNLSKNEYSAHYILYTNNDFNPFLAMSLRYFTLPVTLYSLS